MSDYMEVRKQSRSVDIDHVSETLSDSKVKELKLLYHHYFKKAKLQEWSRVKCRRIRRVLDFGSLAVTAAGVVGGAITANILIVAIVSTAGLIINGSSKLLNLKETEEAHANAHSLYLDLVIRLKSYLRGVEYSERELMIDMATMDRLVGKSTPITKEKYSLKYDEKYEGYSSENNELAQKKEGKISPLSCEPKKGSRLLKSIESLRKASKKPANHAPVAVVRRSTSTP